MWSNFQLTEARTSLMHRKQLTEDDKEMKLDIEEKMAQIGLK